MRAPGYHSPSGPSPPTNTAFVYAMLTCENIPPDGIGYTFELTAQAIAVFDHVFD